MFGEVPNSILYGKWGVPELPRSFGSVDKMKRPSRSVLEPDPIFKILRYGGRFYIGKGKEVRRCSYRNCE